jgi:hypothetical protein
MQSIEQVKLELSDVKQNWQAAQRARYDAVTRLLARNGAVASLPTRLSCVAACSSESQVESLTSQFRRISEENEVMTNRWHAIIATAACLPVPPPRVSRAFLRRIVDLCVPSCLR